MNRSSPSRSPARVALRAALCLTLSGCMSLAPQLEPTDYAKLEQLQTRKDREQAFRDNTVYRHEEPQGTRYTKGNIDGTTKRSWQSLDALLRSDQHSSEALPAKQLRRSRVFTALAIASSILFVAGSAATARDGFDFKRPTAANVTMLGGVLASVAFAVAAGVLFRRARKGYDHAVDVYNDSLGMRLGVMTPEGAYIPPAEVEVDAEGFVVTEDRLAPGMEGPRPVAAPPAPQVQPAPTGPPAPSGPSPGQARASAPSRPSASPPAPVFPAGPVGPLTLLPQR